MWYTFWIRDLEYWKLLQCDNNASHIHINTSTQTEAEKCRLPFHWFLTSMENSCRSVGAVGSSATQLPRNSLFGSFLRLASLRMRWINNFVNKSSHSRKSARFQTSSVARCFTMNTSSSDLFWIELYCCSKGKADDSETIERSSRIRKTSKVINP